MMTQEQMIGGVLRRISMIWITGRAKSGKTTLAYKLHEIIKNSVVLDGDKWRSIMQVEGFSQQDRMNWMMTIGKIALGLEKEGLIPIIALVSPYSKIRKQILSTFEDPTLIFIPGSEENMWKGSDYEEPTKDECKNFVIYQWR